MPITRKSKILLTVAAVPLVVIVVAAITLKFVFTGDRLKSLVIPRIEEATHRSVAVNAISLSLFPAIGIDVDGVQIANRRGPGFSTDPFLSLERLRVNVKLLPLVRGRVEVSSVVLDRPKLLIETNEERETNYDDLSGTAEQPQATPPSREPSINTPAPGSAPASQPAQPEGALSISGFRLNDGEIDYVDHKENSATRLRGVNSDLTLDWQSGRLTVETKTSIADLSYGSVETPLISGLRVSLAPRMVYDAQNDELTIEKGDITVQDMSMTLVGTVKEVKSTRNLDLSMGSANLNIAELLSLVPKEYMKNAEGLSGKGNAAVQINISGAVSDSSSPDVKGSIKADGASVQYAKLPKPISNISIVSNFTRSRSSQEFRIEKLTASLGENPIAMSMSIHDFADPSMALAVQGSMNLAEINQYYPLEQGTSLSGKLSVNVNVSGKVKDPSTLKADGTLQFSNVTAQSSTSRKPVRDLNGTILFNNQLIESKNLSMSIGHSDLSLAFWLKNYLSLASTDKSVPRPVANVTLQSKHLYTADIMTEEGAGQKPAAAPAAQTASSPAQPAVKTPAPKTTLPFPTMEIDVNGTVGTFTMQNYEFTNVRMMMHIANGVVTMQNFSMDAFGGSVISKGSVSLQNPEKPVFDMSLDMNSVDAPTLLTHFTSFGSRLKGRLTMNTTMKGALNDTLGVVPSTLDGAGKVMIQNGSLNGFKVNQSIASALKLPDLENVAFKDWSNGFTIKDGRIQIKDLKISALNGDYVVNGSQGIDGSLDYATSLYLPEKTSSAISVGGFTGDAINAFKDPTGRLKFDFNVGGTTDDPKVQLNTDAARKRVEDLAKQKVQDEAKKLEEQAKKKAGDVLRNIFKGKK